jgi:hypothetical protein
MIVGWLAMSAAPSVCAAQMVSPGTVELAGVTSLTANRQTLSMVDATGQLQSTDINVTSIIFGFEGTYYVSRRFGIGGLVSHQQVRATAPDEQAVANLASTYFGPLVQVRLPLGGRSTFALIGSYGGTTTTLVNQHTGIGMDENVTAVGKYWLVGGGLSLELTSNASFDFGVRYQDSTYRGAPGTGKTTGAGLLVNVAFSLYFGS